MAKHLNVQIALSLTADYWAGAEFWEDSGKNPEINLDWMLEHCEVIDIGVDGGGLDDLLGISAVGRLKDNPRMWAAWFHAWAHPSVLERRKEIAPVLLDFAKQGDLTIVHRIGDDSDEVAGLAARVYQSGWINAVLTRTGSVRFWTRCWNMAFRKMRLSVCRRAGSWARRLRRRNASLRRAVLSITAAR